MGDYWRGGGLEDSSDLDGASPPAYSSGEGYGFKAKQQAQKKNKTSGEDDYDFEIEGADGSDEDLDLGGYQPRPGLKSSVDSRRASGDSRRKSTDQRMMEIIARSKEHAASKSQADSAASGATACPGRHAEIRSCMPLQTFEGDMPPAVGVGSVDAGAGGVAVDANSGDARSGGAAAGVAPRATSGGCTHAAAPC